MLTIDYANCLSDRVGPHGLDPARLDPSGDPAAGMAALTERLAASRGTGWERWRDGRRRGQMQRRNTTD